MSIILDADETHNDGRSLNKLEGVKLAGETGRFRQACTAFLGLFKSNHRSYLGFADEGPFTKAQINRIVKDNAPRPE